MAGARLATGPEASKAAAMTDDAFMALFPLDVRNRLQRPLMAAMYAIAARGATQRPTRFQSTTEGPILRRVTQENGDTDGDAPHWR
jgi:hypothetical protein